MKPVTKKIGLIASVLAFFITVILGLPRLGFAGGSPVRSGKSRGFFRASARSSEHVKPAPSSLKRRKFLVVQDQFDQPVPVSVQQTIAVSPAEPKKTAKNMIYTRPCWVETVHGVLVLEPGHWVELEPGADY